MRQLRGRVSLEVRDISTGKTWRHLNISVEEASWILLNPNLEVEILNDEDVKNVEDIQRFETY